MKLIQKLSAETKFIRVGNTNVRVNVSAVKFVDQSKPAVVFFHGFSFSIDDWDRMGTLRIVREHGFQVVAVDLPRGKSTKSDKMELERISDYNSFLDQLLPVVGIAEKNGLVIIGPSMGGGFALTYALDHPERVLGLVLIAPALHELMTDSIKSLKRDIPILLVWGEEDDVFPLDEYVKPIQELLPNSRLVTLKGARHPAYLDKPEEFHANLLNFLKDIKITKS